MKRKLICAILCLLVVLSSAGICFAEPLPCVVDEAGLLSQQETDSLTEKAEDLRHTYEMDVVILTVTSLNGKSSMAYAEDYYDESGYGIDAQRSGVLFLLAMEERELYIDTSGDAVYGAQLLTQPDGVGLSVLSLPRTAPGPQSLKIALGY